MSNRYKAQIDEALHHINMMVRQDWTGASSNAFKNATSILTIATIACVSTRNLHIIFRAYTNETVSKYINRIRLEYTLQLLKEGKYTHAQIADRIGFANDTALYNTFRKLHNQTPSEYKANLPSLAQTNANVDSFIINLEETPIIFLSYIGKYDDYTSAVFEEASWDCLYDYAIANNLLPENDDYWGICYDDTNITDAEKCRFYACMPIKHSIKSRLTDEIKSMTLPSGQYAVYTHKGSYNQLDTFYDAILRNLPQGYNLHEGLIIERYLNSPIENADEELLTEILLPVTGLK